ncbi:hypothetical protein RCH06_002863, partial [Polaromonas sp. CG_9.5]|uniref:hypothetical protein n=1 Tax=Polaromonas sp. CG_9.5 TaxID=3071705 RepID=UPI002E00A9EC|nr:hypothetical protein [Polaromonas sp. CG_9.5]
MVPRARVQAGLKPLAAAALFNQFSSQTGLLRKADSNLKCNTFIQLRCEDEKTPAVSATSAART